MSSQDRGGGGVYVPAAGDDALILVTCWPLDALRPGGPERLVLVARPVARAATPARG